MKLYELLVEKRKAEERARGASVRMQAVPTKVACDEWNHLTLEYQGVAQALSARRREVAKYLQHPDPAGAGTTSFKFDLLCEAVAYLLFEIDDREQRR